MNFIKTPSLLKAASKPNKMLTWPLLLRALSYIFQGKLTTHRGHLPQQNHAVPMYFVGVGIASAEDPQVDDYVISQLKNLAIKEVRLDFTYGDLDGFNARFLSRLIAEQFAITLHIVPPMFAAKRMEDPLELATYSAFLTSVLDAYGSALKRIEFGNTINRRRWAGFTLNGFLKAWAITHQLVKARNIILAGPNVTDFELPYNIGLLSIFKAQKTLPDIHTNNLFSERISQPERYDHRVFGFRWSTIFKVNLVKKAKLLKKISTDFGIKHLISPAAFWAIYRIERVLDNGIQKQADYAARYFILTAASGALDQVFWGTFICHREGLINDGLTDDEYPLLERIAHYAKVDGKIENFQPYPSFHAVKTVANLIQGAQYRSAFASTNGLEMHHFTSATNEIMAIWCLNGRVALLNKLLSELDINAALLMDRDGTQLKPANTMLSHQVLASESPIYVLLPLGYTFDLTSTAHQKRVLEPALVIHRHLDNYQYFPFEADGWVGMVMAKSQQEAALLAFDLHPEKLAKPSKENTLRDARNAIWPVSDPRDEDEKITVKQPVRMYAHKQLFDRFKPSKARRSWSGAFELLRRGIDTAKPVAFFEKIDDTTLKQNFYICDFVKTDCNVGQLMCHFATGNVSFTANINTDAEDTQNKTVTAESVYGQLATYLNNMHSKGVFFRDLSGGNVLVNINARGRLHFSLIDTARARFYNHSISMSQRLDDMTRICHKLHWAGRKRLMGLYLANIGKKFGLRYQLSFHLYDIKVSLKRTVGRKGIKKLMAFSQSLRS